MLASRADTDPEGLAFTFEGRSRSYGGMWRAAGRAAALVRRSGVGSRENVVIALPNGSAFFDAFYGVLRAGAVAVPVFPGLGPQQVAASAERCDARLIVCGDDRAAANAEATGVSVLAPSQWQDAPPLRASAELAPEDIAFIQYTSGSTGEPHGVMISHRNVLTNIEQMIAGMAITGDDRFVSWLPTYHDMGLILMTMAPFSLGAPLQLLPTSLRDVRRWLETIRDTRGTFTAAPDFAYRLLLRKVDEPLEVPSLRMALNAAEPVRAATVAEFDRRLGRQGVMVAGYGLSEATVGVTTWPPGTTPRVDDRGIVSVGPPFPGVKIRIAEGGEVLVASIATPAGYYGEPRVTAEVFGEDGFVHTGDLGPLDADGNLYIVGRSKEIIIVGGRNVAPHEISQIVDDRPEVRLAAAVGIDRGRQEGEQAHVFAEVRDVTADASTLHRLAVDIAADVGTGLGIRPARVHLVRPGTIPLTHNGKVRLTALREVHVAGELQRQGAELYP
jgi:acyl-CoA synthetase (AMP-forming)/AMP-acid ligase II